MKIRIVMAAVIGALCCVIVPIEGPAVAAGSTAGSCTEAPIEVSLGPGQPTTSVVYTWYCAPAVLRTDAVQVVVSGTSYDHTYWDFPYEPSTYSYVDAMMASGIPVLNFDRIGVGLSSRPPAADVNLASEAWVLHQLVGDLRTGRFGPSFSQVIVVGHSLGSLIALFEDATEHDASGMIITGLVHVPENPFGAERLVASFYPAQLDPKFRSAGEPLGYLTTRPGTREADFDHVGDTSTAVVAVDEATKQLTNPFELGSAPAALAARPDPVPVLDVMGQFDNLFCAPSGCAGAANPLALDPRFYPDPAKVQTYLLPGSGHDVNLAENAPMWFAVAAHWTWNRFPGP